MTFRGFMFSVGYDRQMKKAERDGLRAARQALLESASGNVLEVGAGTGASIACYGPQVKSITLTEPEAMLVRKLEHKIEGDARIKVIRAPAEDLPFDDDSFDTVVASLVLCGVDDQPRALREIRRVLRPGGQLLFMEHVRSDDEKLARHQDRMNGVNRFVVGCDCNRPTVTTMGQAGFTVSNLEHSELPHAPKFARPLVVGTATR
jgi:ubiquinone/menaquinone biosynthesis C-methylase UbiE